MDLREVPTAEFERHPWELARSRFFQRLLDTIEPMPSGIETVLDVGAGDGWFSEQLATSLRSVKRVVCWDAGYDEHGPTKVDDERIVFSRTQPTGQFDLLLLLDVCEHVEDDRQFLAEVLGENASPDTVVVFSVPAWPELMSSHDLALGHYRRYRPGQARQLLEDVGLQPILSGGLFHSLLLPRSVKVLQERVLGPSGRRSTLEWKAGARLRRLVSRALAIDGALSRLAATRRRELPGLSWWALCRMH